MKLHQILGWLGVVLFCGISQAEAKGPKRPVLYAQEQSTLEALPMEIQGEVYAFLDQKGRRAFAATSKRYSKEMRQKGFINPYDAPSAEAPLTPLMQSEWFKQHPRLLPYERCVIHSQTYGKPLRAGVLGGTLIEMNFGTYLYGTLFCESKRLGIAFGIPIAMDTFRSVGVTFLDMGFSNLSIKVRNLDGKSLASLSGEYSGAVFGLGMPIGVKGDFGFIKHPTTGVRLDITSFGAPLRPTVVKAVFQKATLKVLANSTDASNEDTPYLLTADSPLGGVSLPGGAALSEFQFHRIRYLPEP